MSEYVGTPTNPAVKRTSCPLAPTGTTPGPHCARAIGVWNNRYQYYPVLAGETVV